MRHHAVQTNNSGHSKITGATTAVYLSLHHEELSDFHTCLNSQKRTRKWEKKPFFFPPFSFHLLHKTTKNTLSRKAHLDQAACTVYYSTYNIASAVSKSNSDHGFNTRVVPQSPVTTENFPLMSLDSRNRQQT